MLHFRYSSLIDAPVEVVWDFHRRSDILHLLTPPWQPVEIIRREGGLEVGAITEFRLWLGPIPVQWLAVHTECDRYRLFTDEQKQGPMESWVHRHQFSSEQGKTRLTDVITYSPPGGWLAENLLAWWVNSRLEDMFRYRHQVTQTECEKH
ncbi:MAG: SRPBCC family protein [Limnoraphis robusta]|uniref:SRPBCC family protein n=1 Tax=Limnoraphis robusta CCNP1315 TaxID=3110306 RepID=A0ABU5U2G5_9CYAN|nr:SRPBCC family protein [Limnoraphis robusta]MEA5496042.1 SRPBCC family protein [Limnoraphis robusta BA-68 BA1]MEA5520318.1 SRPBCC family protein [Limnoraphis robusta CCNP1315]MEA5542682.1 SRPBCC family protein [Limnoraphis robusta Tam1]MEA5548315.1 SRPBCC family protein [Limnoraphis robusta CCNP1324]